MSKAGQGAARWRRERLEWLASRGQGARGARERRASLATAKRGRAAGWQPSSSAKSARALAARGAAAVAGEKAGGWQARLLQKPGSAARPAFAGGAPSHLGRACLPPWRAGAAAQVSASLPRGARKAARGARLHFSRAAAWRGAKKASSRAAKSAGVASRAALLSLGRPREALLSSWAPPRRRR